ncbi:MAG: Zn-ribbon domain-containing OB-fold protein [Chloroflexota bacterium]|nr:Zn-ribbon domain-containing OB-fold protein [Chloroflexota bacterium]
MKILPAASALTQPYWDGARQHKLMFQQCRACGTNWHPPMPICPECHSRDIGWIEAGGHGIVYSFTIVHHPTHPAFQEKVPYVVAIVQLDEGPRVVTNILNCDVHAVHGGMSVSVTYQDVTDSLSLPQFEPAPN